MTDAGTPIDKLALHPTNTGIKTTLQVAKPFQIQSGVIASQPWGAGGAMLSGGGIQYFASNGVADLIAKGFLIII